MCLPCVILQIAIPSTGFPSCYRFALFFVLSHKILIYVVCRMSGTPKSDKKYVKLPLTNSRLQLQRAVHEVLDTVRETPTQREIEREGDLCAYVYLASMIAETMPTNYINHSKCHVLNRAQDTSDTLDTRQRDKRQTPNDSATDDMRVDMTNVVVETLNGSAAAWLTRFRRSRSVCSKRPIAKLSIKLMHTSIRGLYLNQPYSSDM